MFKSDFSGKSSKPKESPVKLVIKKRKKTYENNITLKTNTLKPVNKVKITNGWEIVKEINVLQSEFEDAKKKYEIE